MTITSSLLTNVAASTALLNLENTALQLQGVQSEISTGLAVSSAKDNASYFSIATVLRSDSSALSNISSTLNLGDSSLSVASTALSQILNTTLSDIKNQLVRATEPDADMTTLQQQITQDQAQLQNIANSANFNGLNYLSVNSGETGYNATKSFISSYSRDSTGVISVGFININTTDTALFNPNFSAASDATATPPAGGQTTVADEVATSGVTGFTETSNGTAGDGNGIGATTYTAGATATTGTLAFTSYSGDTATTAPYTSFSTNISVANTSSTSAVTDTIANATPGALATGDVAGQVATSSAYQASYNSTTGNLTFYVAENTNSTTPAYQYHKFTVSNVSSAPACILDKTDTATVGSYTDANKVTTTTATGTGVSIMGINISGLTDSAANLATLNAYQKQVDAAISSVATSAATLGAAQARIEAQSSFVTSLQSSINNGVGSLVDADLNVASTRLQSLQVQQQLGVQSLSIANQSSQMILKLFGG